MQFMNFIASSGADASTGAPVTETQSIDGELPSEGAGAFEALVADSTATPSGSPVSTDGVSVVKNAMQNLTKVGGMFAPLQDGEEVAAPIALSEVGVPDIIGASSIDGADLLSSDLEHKEELLAAELGILATPADIEMHSAPISITGSTELPAELGSEVRDLQVASLSPISQALQASATMTGTSDESALDGLGASMPLEGVLGDLAGVQDVGLNVTEEGTLPTQDVARLNPGTTLLGVAAELEKAAAPDAAVESILNEFGDQSTQAIDFAPAANNGPVAVNATVATALARGAVVQDIDADASLEDASVEQAEATLGDIELDIDSAQTESGNTALPSAVDSPLISALNLQAAATDGAGSSAISFGLVDDFQTTMGSAQQALGLNASFTQELQVDFSSRFATQISEAAKQLPDGPIEISLSPEELGKVKLTFQVSEAGAMNVVVAAERPETLELLRRNADTLLQDFQDLGYEQSSFEFQQDGQSAEQNGDGEQPNRESFDFNASAGQSPLNAPETSDMPLARLTLDAASGVDIRL